MSYIIVHVDDPKDLRSMDILPDQEGEGVQVFDSKIEASHFLGIMRRKEIFLNLLTSSSS